MISISSDQIEMMALEWNWNDNNMISPVKGGGNWRNGN
jgi:hypothetical protein